MGITGYQIENITTVENRNGEIVAIDSDKDPTVILLHYNSLLPRKIDYIPPRVKIEISCLSMDEPVEECDIRSLICETFPEDDTDAACRIRTVVPTRTFLEKIFLLAEEFQKEKPRSMRMTRHLYDLERLMDSDFGRFALADKTLYDAIIEHRKAYYALKYVDYSLHSPATINILPPENVLDDWRKDFLNMQRYFIYGESLDFDQLMKRMMELQRRLRNM